MKSFSVELLYKGKSLRHGARKRMLTTVDANTARQAEQTVKRDWQKFQTDNGWSLEPGVTFKAEEIK